MIYNKIWSSVLKKKLSKNCRKLNFGITRFRIFFSTQPTRFYSSKARQIPWKKKASEDTGQKLNAFVKHVLSLKLIMADYISPTCFLQSDKNIWSLLYKVIMGTKISFWLNNLLWIIFSVIWRFYLIQHIWYYPHSLLAHGRKQSIRWNWIFGIFSSWNRT